MESQTLPPKRSHKKVYWIIGGSVFILILIILGFLYSVGYIKVRTAFCSFQGKTLVYPCSSLGCDVSSGKCLETTKDYGKICIQNSECSSGLCLPEGIDVLNDPVTPTIASLKEKDPVYISGYCSKVLVSQECSKNRGLPAQKEIKKLEEAYAEYNASEKRVGDRMDLDFFYGPLFSGDVYNCGTYD